MNERSQLLDDHNQRVPFHFDSSILRERQRRIKRFQCCFCTVALSVSLVVLVVIFALSINAGSKTQSVTPPTLLPFDMMAVLLANKYPLPDHQTKHENYTSPIIWISAIQAADAQLKHCNEFERSSPSLLVHSPSFRHYKSVATTERATNMSRAGYRESVAVQHLSISPASDKCFVGELQLWGCPIPKAICDPRSTKRTYNGTCNNLLYPERFGVAFTPFRRGTAADYGDGLNSPRRAKYGGTLPSARTVSLTVHRPYYRSDGKFSVLLAVWGQFLDHDITATASSRKSNGSSISCCALELHPECYPVLLDARDPFMRYNVSCLEFVRSSAAPQCCLGQRQQLNQASAYIDGSVVYGNDDETVRKLRTFTGGSLLMYVTEDNRTLLPISRDPDDGCNRILEYQRGRYCFLAGDLRANENVHLTSMHLIWARQHNFIANQLSHLNPHWDDEQLFQASRSILGAQMQHITYNEFLPVILGNRIMKSFYLLPQRHGYFAGYNSTVDASIANEFAASAFRFAHTIIPGLMKLLSNDTTSPDYVLTHRMLFNPFQLYDEGELDRILRGALDTSIEATDAFFTEELKEHLFEQTEETDKSPQLCGLDLVSLNIQRGRDHGLPGYNSWRQYCGLEKVRRFEELKNDMDDDVLDDIRRIYRNVDDIDLYTGGLSERPINDSMLGATMTCLILDQFYRLKYGDRFWYENPDVFTPKQLSEIRKTSLALIICDNADHVEAVPMQVMVKSNAVVNPIRSCSSLRTEGVNWAKWTEPSTRISIAQGNRLEIKTNHS